MNHVSEKQQHSNGHSTEVPPDLFSRVKHVVGIAPARIEETIRQNPVRALAIACAAGVGIGMLVSSRVLRAAAMSAASYAATELVRQYGAKWLGVERAAP